MGPRETGVGCRRVQVATRQEGVAFPRPRRPHRADRRQRVLNECAHRAGAWDGGVALASDGVEPTAPSGVPREQALHRHHALLFPVFSLVRFRSNSVGPRVAMRDVGADARPPGCVDDLRPRA